MNYRLKTEMIRTLRKSLNVVYRLLHLTEKRFKNKEVYNYLHVPDKAFKSGKDLMRL